MKRIDLAVLAFTLLPGIVAAQRTSRPISDSSNAELIDRLMDVSNEEFGVYTNLLPYGDFAQAAPQGLLRLGDKAPSPGAVMQEIVRRGAIVVPDLAAHVDDARKTRAVIKTRWPGLRYVAKYDWNRITGAVSPNIIAVASVEHPDIKGSPEKEEYTFAVGDICFKLIGDIVNRDFEPAFYRPSMNVFVNSPVLCPDLAKAVRDEWGGLTEKQHRTKLLADVAKADEYGRRERGLKTLARYYPSDVPPDDQPVSPEAGSWILFQPDAFRLGPTTAPTLPPPSNEIFDAVSTTRPIGR